MKRLVCHTGMRCTGVSAQRFLRPHGTVTPLALVAGHPAIPLVEALVDRGFVLGRSKPRESSGSLFEAFAMKGEGLSVEDGKKLADVADAIATPDATHPRMLGTAAWDGKTDSDDDGEKGAGRRILEVAVAARHREEASVGVAIVVTRYYGGVLLGKKRWALIRDVAHDALQNVP